MKVLHINCNYLGTALHQEMMKHLNQFDLKNDVFVPVFEGTKSVVDPIENVVVDECFDKWNRFIFDFKQNKILSAVQNQYECDSYDLIHAYTLFTDGNCAYNLSLKYGIPFIVTVRNTDLNDFFKFRINLRNRGINILKKAFKIVFLSESYQIELFNKYLPKSLHNEIRKKCVIIPNGIDDFWHKHKYLPGEDKGAWIRSSRRLNIVYAGLVNSNKNPLLTVDAINYLISLGWKVKFTIVGDIGDNSIYRKLKKIGFIYYCPKVSKEDLIHIYRNNDIFVMPSHKESFGLVYAEAMSQGLPVIYTRGQGFDRQFTDGEVGYSVNSNDPVELWHNILKIVERYSSISENCYLKSSKFDWSLITQNYYHMYKEI